MEAARVPAQDAIAENCSATNGRATCAELRNVVEQLMLLSEDAKVDRRSGGKYGLAVTAASPDRRPRCVLGNVG